MQRKKCPTLALHTWWRRMKKIAVEAYFNANLGDDLFVSMLCRRYPAVDFYARGPKVGAAVRRGLPNLHYLINDRRSFSRTVYWGIDKFRSIVLSTQQSDVYVQSCDGRVLISGSCFMQRSGPSVIDWHRFFIGPNTVVLGCNFGPYDAPWYLETYREIFAHARSVCFRDKASYDLFQELQNVTWAPDIVFGYDRHDVELPQEKGYLLLCPAPIDKDGQTEQSQYWQDYVDFHVRMIRTAQTRGRQVILLGFCKEQDMTTVHEIVEKLPDKFGVRQLCYPDLSIRQAVGYVANAGMVLATRYHAMILALLFGRRVFSICYSDKTSHVIRDLRCNIPHCRPDQLHKLAAVPLLEELEKDFTLADQQEIRAVTTGAQRQFSALDNMLRHTLT